MNVAERVASGATGPLVLARCLGAFRLQDSAGNQLQVRTRKARALLAVLAMQGRPMSRDALADLLWSDRGPAQARSSLRQSIFELQHLDSRGGSLLVAGREDVAVSREALVTDLELVRTASAAGDWPRLLTLLESSSTGLLADLDGLDPELDDWLRLQRAHEPEKSFSAAVEAAERCAAQAGPRAALDLVGEILRLDPVNEEARRLAMRLAHELGDKVALHRQFAALSDRLRQDFDAEPSEETIALFKALANGNGHARPQELAVEHDVQRPAPPPKRSRWKLAALPLMLVVVAAGLALTLWLRSAPVARERVIVAVLPFDQQPADQGFLAEGLWEQTRGALTRNAAIRVLGRTTTAVMAQQEVPPAEYRKRFGVTHLLEGSVRRSGANILVSVSLTRTSDGVAVWQDAFRGRMGEPFALQGAIASGIEGKLRARLAPGGGRRADQIATSPEVYALYSEARQLISTRERANFRRAESLLRQAVKQDPNYAPALSLLGAAIFFNGRLAIVDAAARAEGVAVVQRAISLAPNFAPSYASLALIEGEGSPESEVRLRRAVALDPNYSEAWSWLGNALYAQSRYREAKQAYEHALEIDPLFEPAVYNLQTIAEDLGDDAAVDRLLQGSMRAGRSVELITGIKVERAYHNGDYSASLNLLRKDGIDAAGHPKRFLWGAWLYSLTGIGFYDQLHHITGCPEWYAPLVRSKVLPPTTFQGKPVRPEEFWTSQFFSTPASRAMINLGQPAKLVKLYRDGFRDADEFVTVTDGRNMLPELAANVAVALESQGSEEEATYLLRQSSQRLEKALQRQRTRGIEARLAMIRAVQEDKAQAAALLDAAVRQGWLPDGRNVAIDLAEEPAFRILRGEPRFEAARKRILDHIAKERAELGPLQV